MLEENKEKFEQLLEEFLIDRDCNPDDAIKKINQLKNLSAKEAVSILNFFAGKETEPKVLLHIIQMIGKIKDKSSVSVLIEILTDYKNAEEQDKYLKVRCTTAGILGELKDDSAVIPLMYIMNDKNEYYKVRLIAAEALGKIGNAHAVLPLINIVTDEEEKSVYLRESAAKALGMLGDERAIDPLISIIETKKGIIDKFTFLKEKTIEALRKLGFKQDRKLNALKKALEDDSPQVRISAMEALCDIDDEIIITLIEPLLYDKEEDVSVSALNALYNIEGKDFVVNLLQKSDLSYCCRQEIYEILEEDDEEDKDE